MTQSWWSYELHARRFYLPSSSRSFVFMVDFKAAGNDIGDVSVPPSIMLKTLENDDLDGTSTAVPSGATTPALGHATPEVILTDQTNFLPTKQVITVFMGLSVALACALLDQTV